jgi:hypothetical protein
MAVQYVNRKGNTYYLLAGQTKTGKPKYYMSKKRGETAVEVMPEGYEIHESPADGLVHVRKIRPSRLLPAEREQVAEAIRELTGQERFLIDIDGDSLVIYWPDTNADRTLQALTSGRYVTTSRRASIKAWLESTGTYSAKLRFTLVDADRRLFDAERWCFRGSIDDWIPLRSQQPLDTLLKAYVPHLGQESFFDLM